MLLSSRRTLTLPSAALSLLGPGLGALLLCGCFLGDAADGLECELDADCGLGVECVADPAAAGAKCCGGSCLAAGTRTGPGSTSTATESESSASTEGSSTTMVEPCGNDVWDADQGEICDATAPDGPACGRNCTLCGNNEVDEGETCDNSDNKNCDENCNYTELCGNGSVELGEVCDVWALPEGQTCDDCTEWVAFDWSARDMAGLGGFCSPDTDCTRWRVIPGSGVLGSGEYVQVGGPWSGPPAWPEAVLRTEPMAFPALRVGDVVRVTLNHEFALNYQIDPALYVDHVELALESGGSEPVVRNIVLGDDLISCTASIGPDCRGRAVTEDYCAGGGPLRRAGGVSAPPSPTTSYTYQVPADGLDAGEQRLRFTVRYDCSNFENGGTTALPVADDAWKIHGVRVSIEKANR